MGITAIIMAVQPENIDIADKRRPENNTLVFQFSKMLMNQTNTMIVPSPPSEFRFSFSESCEQCDFSDSNSPKKVRICTLHT